MDVREKVRVAFERAMVAGSDYESYKEWLNGPVLESHIDLVTKEITENLGTDYDNMDGIIIKYVDNYFKSVLWVKNIKKVNDKREQERKAAEEAERLKAEQERLKAEQEAAKEKATKALMDKVNSLKALCAGCTSVDCSNCIAKNVLKVENETTKEDKNKTEFKDEGIENHEKEHKKYAKSRPSNIGSIAEFINDELSKYIEPRKLTPEQIEEYRKQYAEYKKQREEYRKQIKEYRDLVSQASNELLNLFIHLI